jgi:hypothetical protein
LRTSGGRRRRRQKARPCRLPDHFHRPIPMLRTAPAACLHRLSTGLCTARLDAGTGCRETVRAIR